MGAQSLMSRCTKAHYQSSLIGAQKRWRQNPPPVTTTTSFRTSWFQTFTRYSNTFSPISIAHDYRCWSVHFNQQHREHSLIMYKYILHLKCKNMSDLFNMYIHDVRYGSFTIYLLVHFLPYAVHKYINTNVHWIPLTTSSVTTSTRL